MDSTKNEGLRLPNDSWTTIASFLDNDDLAKFRQLCRVTQLAGSDMYILQPLYNRLYALDNTLPPLLLKKGTLIAFKQAFKKIQARQQFEMTYLTQHHPSIMAKPEYVQVFQENTAISLQSLEAINAGLDKVNSEIIRKKINPNNTSFNLNKIRITRLPIALFQEPVYAHFWQKLTYLNCDNNQLTALNVQSLATLYRLDCNNNQLSTLHIKGLAVLRSLDCSNNKLTTLNLQGLTSLQGLECGGNQLTSLNVQELIALGFLDCKNNLLTTLNVSSLASLWFLDCNNNQLIDLHLTGVHKNTKNKYAELERTLLFSKLSQTESPKDRRDIICRLGDDYTTENCLKYCPVYAATLLTSASANSVYHFASSTLAQVSAFLPYFSLAGSLKRKRDKDEIDTEKLLEESDNQPDLKKRKRK